MMLFQSILERRRVGLLILNDIRSADPTLATIIGIILVIYPLLRRIW